MEFYQCGLETDTGKITLSLSLYLGTLYNCKHKQAEVEVRLTQAETVSLEIGIIKGWTIASRSRFNLGKEYPPIFAFIEIKL